MSEIIWRAVAIRPPLSNLCFRRTREFPAGLPTEATMAARPSFAKAPEDNPLGFAAKVGGADRDRTDDLKLAKLALSQLSYGPM